MVKKVALLFLAFTVSVVVLPASVAAGEVAAGKEKAIKKNKFSDIKVKFENGIPIPERPDGQRYKRCEKNSEGKSKCPGMDSATITDIQTITIVNYSYNPECQTIKIGELSYYWCM